MRKRSKKRNLILSKRMQLLRISAAAFIFAVAIVLVLSALLVDDNFKEREMRGMWVSYGDFPELGLQNKDEVEFRENVERLLDKAEEYGVNTVFFHVRAFRDAAYKSDYFPTASYLWTYTEPIEYDALEIMVEMAHEWDMELHAWLNPYRNTSFDEEILNPADQESTEEILLCVNEIINNYDVDGIHFDDYFYEEGDSLSNSYKMANVNLMVSEVYKTVHSTERNIVFGISPAGNIEYCESTGADVRTWISEEGYVDYIIPQIYWTDRHQSDLYDRMFSDALQEWIAMNAADVDLYAGLAAYKAGTVQDEDPGWSDSTENLCSQVQTVRAMNCDGFVFFSAADFFRNGANEELGNYRNLVL